MMMMMMQAIADQLKIRNFLGDSQKRWQAIHTFLESYKMEWYAYCVRVCFT